MRLDGKVAIVTGASRGIGRAISQGLAAHGARVVVASRTEVDTSHGSPHQKYASGTIVDTVKAQTVKKAGDPFINNNIWIIFAAAAINRKQLILVAIDSRGYVIRVRKHIGIAGYSLPVSSAFLQDTTCIDLARFALRGSTTLQ